ncbi:female-specific lacrimal gland protein-like [Peromyscus maniculatus bairdii]|uniref:female-specific lacrimal gland protein-like n=1 Tax=Peromyscus maniculatus bairdii TaxID=230844 RepID=UPI003FD60C25
MKILLLFAVVYLVCAANQSPSKMKLQTETDSSKFSGNFCSIYLASSDTEMTKENGLLRIYTHNIRYNLNRNNSRELSVTFYTREDDSCENHTVVAEYIGHLVFDKQGNTIGSQKKGNGEYTGSSNFWTLTTRFRPIPRFWIYSPDLGKRATSSTLDNDSKEEYFKATNLYNIPSENIRDMTQTDSCPS